MYIISIFLFIAAIALWLISRQLCSKRQIVFQRQSYEDSMDSEEWKIQEEMKLQEIRALDAFAGMIRTISLICLVLGIILLGL